MNAATITDLEKQKVFKCDGCESDWQDYDSKYELDDGRLFCRDCFDDLKDKGGDK